MEASGHLSSTSWNFRPEGSLNPAKHYVAHKPTSFSVTTWCHSPEISLLLGSGVFLPLSR